MPLVTSLQATRLPEPAATAAAQPAASGAPAPRAEAPAQALPNPSLRLDASLGLVVLEFRDADGTARTIPSERELDAYRSAARAQRQGAEEAPDGPARARAAAPQPAPGQGTDPAPAPSPPRG